MPVTIKDIARIADVSHTTVSRALRDHPALTPATIARVKLIAAEMGYVPNASARNLKNRRTRALGVVVSSLSDPFWGEVLEGVDSVVHSTGYSLLVAATHRDEEREKAVVQTMVQHGVEGVIICSPQFNRRQSEALTSYGLPMVIVNNDGAAKAESLVFNDDAHGIRLLSRHLIDLGHRRIVYLGNGLGGRTNQERQAEFLRVMKEASLPVLENGLPLASEGTPSGGFDCVMAKMDRRTLPTAIICYNDSMAVGVCKALSELGLGVPRDVSVVGFDDIALSVFLTPSLTTYRQDKKNLGAEAAKLMLEAVESQTPGTGEVKPRTVRLRGDLIVRDSTSPPREIPAQS